MNRGTLSRGMVTLRVASCVHYAPADGLIRRSKAMENADLPNLPRKREDS